MDIECCSLKCNKGADFTIYWGSSPDDYAHACTQHVGENLAVHLDQKAPEYFKVCPITKEP